MQTEQNQQSRVMFANPCLCSSLIASCRAGRNPFEFALCIRILRNTRIRYMAATRKVHRRGRFKCNQLRRIAELMDVRSIEPELRSLMVAGLEGDAAAHKMLLEKLSVQLRGYFKAQLGRYGRDPVEAEDLVQETLIAVHTRRHTYDRSQLLTPWLYAVARYRLVDYLRRTKAMASDVPIEEAEELLADDDPSPVGSGLDLQKLMAQLSPQA